MIEPISNEPSNYLSPINPFPQLAGQLHTLVSYAGQLFAGTVQPDVKTLQADYEPIVADVMSFNQNMHREGAALWKENEITPLVGQMIDANGKVNPPLLADLIKRILQVSLFGYQSTDKQHFVSSIIGDGVYTGDEDQAIFDALHHIPKDASGNYDFASWAQTLEGLLKPQRG